MQTARIEQQRAPRNRRAICQCGHYGSSHDSRRRCLAGKGTCPCTKLVIVDTRAVRVEITDDGRRALEEVVS